MFDDFSDSSTYDDEEYYDPAITSAVGIPSPDRGFNWAGLGDFIQEVTPTAFGIVSAITDRPIAVSGSMSPGAVSVAAGQSPAAASIALGASPAAQSAVALSPITWAIIALGGGLMLFALSRTKAH